MKALNKLQELSKTLKQLDVEHSGKEAELMIRYGLDMSLVDLLKDNPEISDAQNMVIDNMVNRRGRPAANPINRATSMRRLRMTFIMDLRFSDCKGPHVGE